MLIEGIVWRYPGAGGWYFVTAGDTITSFVRKSGIVTKVGRGFVAVSARIGNTEWQTTLFTDKEKGYLIAIKADVRKKERIKDGDAVRIEIIFQ